MSHGRQLVSQRCQCSFGSVDRCPAALWQHNTEFVEQPAELVDLHYANPNELLPHSVQRQHGLLIRSFDGHEAHAGTL